MFTSLLWKEWRECRWKILVLFAIYLALVLVAWAADRRYSLEETQYAVLALAILMPGVIAMGTIADEHVRRTAETLQALPVPMSRVFLVKFLAGLATLFLPLLAIEAFCWLFLPASFYNAAYVSEHPYWALTPVGLTVTLYLWILALGSRRRTELGVGATYVALFLGLGVAAAILELLWSFHGVFPRIVDLLDTLSPLGFIAKHPTISSTTRTPFSLTALAQALTWAPLAVIALWRYTHPRIARIARPLDQPATFNASSLSPRRFPILWKSWREVRRLILLYGILVLAFIVIDSLLIQRALNQGLYFYPGPEMLAILPVLMGLVTIILLGTDVGLREAETHLENFWHSRPIPHAPYFRRRFAFGLFLSLLLLLIPAIFILSISIWQLQTSRPPMELMAWEMPTHRSVISPVLPPPDGPRPVFPDWPASRDFYAVMEMRDFLHRAQGTTVALFLLFAPQAVLFFSLSAFVATLSRRRIIPLMFAFAFAIAFQLLYVGNTFYRWVYEIWDWQSMITWVLYYAYCLTLLILSAALARLATKSTTANWRARLERHLESRAELVTTT